jgi:hypothetical protein
MERNLGQGCFMAKKGYEYHGVKHGKVSEFS